MPLPDQVVRRLERLAAEHHLPESAPAQLAAIVERTATDPEAPTTVTEPDEVVSSHVLGALDGLALEPVRAATRLADLGSGAGFPGLVLAVALPEAHVALVDSIGRKTAFQARAVADAGLENVEPVTARAEDWPAGIGAHDLVTARAVAPLGVLLEYAAPLLAPGGHLLAYKGRLEEDERRVAAASGDLLGMAEVEERPVVARRGAEHLTLHLWSKVSPTPERFPRRTGMARKRPLGA